MTTIAWLCALLATTAAPAAATSPAADAIVRIEHAWIAAAQAHDTATLARILADDFIDTNVHGEVRDKSAALSAHAAPPGTTQSLHDLRVRHYGDTAIATGINVVHSRSAGWTVRVAFTDVFVRRHGHWQAVSAQETLR